MAAFKMWFWLICGVSSIWAGKIQKVRKFKHDPGFVIKYESEYRFYDHVEYVTFDVPQNMHTIPTSHTAPCSEENYFCKIVKKMDDFNEAEERFLGEIQATYHKGGEYGEPAFIFQNDVMKSGEDENPEEKLEKEPNNSTNSGNSREGRAVGPVIMIAKGLAKAAPFFLPLLFKGKKIDSVKKILKDNSIAEYAIFHQELRQAPEIIKSQQNVLDKLQKLNLEAENILRKIEEEHKKGAEENKLVIGHLVRLLLNANVEIAENTNSMMVTNSNSMCTLGHLPLSAVPKDVFDERYSEFIGALPKGKEMLVGLHKTSTFYTEPFSKCVLDSEDGIVITPIMDIRKGHRYELLNLIPIVHKKGERGFCKINLLHNRVLYDKTSQNLIPLSHDHTFECLANTKYCEIPRTFTNSRKEVLCILGILNDDEYNLQNCELDCADSNDDVQIFHSESSIYITDASRIDVRVNGRLEATYSGEHIYGVLKIELPCNAIVNISGFMVDSNLMNCENKVLAANIMAPANFFPKELVGQVKNYKYIDDFSDEYIRDLKPTSDWLAELKHDWNSYTTLEQWTTFFTVGVSILSFITILTAVGCKKLPFFWCKKDIKDKVDTNVDKPTPVSDSWRDKSGDLEDIINETK